MIWALFALMTGVAVVALLVPLVRPRAETAGAGDARSLYEAELAGLERDRSRGLVGDDEARATRIEAARRLLSRSDQEGGAPARSSVSLSTRWIAAALVGLLVPATALVLYRTWGQPGRPDLPLVARATGPVMTVDDAVTRIERHLAANPGDGRGHDLVAPVYLETGRHADALRAYAQAIRLLGDSASRRTGLGEAKVFLASGVVTAEARVDFEAAVAMEPRAPRARYYLALAAEQDGQKDKAAGIYRAIIADGPPEAPWIPRMEARLAQLTGVPAGSPADAIASLPADQQAVAITGMVDQLAARLAQSPQDAEGWLRLVRAQSVLGRNDTALASLAAARQTFAGDAAVLSRLDDLSRELRLEQTP